MSVEELWEAATERLAAISEDAKLLEAAKLLAGGTELVVVCNGEGKLRGVVTKTDVVKQISVCQGATCMRPVSAVMTRDVIFCRENEVLQQVAIVMKEHHLKTIPVVDGENRPVGVLTARAVLRALLSDAEFEEAQLINYVKGIGYR